MFGGEKFTIPPECPLEFSVGLSSGDFRGAFTALLGDDAAAQFWAQRPTHDDVEFLATEVFKVYGMGEAGASGGSSKRTSSRSRPISNGTTA